MTNEELKLAFEQCKKNGTAEEWDTLAMAYYGRGYLMNAHFCFRKADVIRLIEKRDIGPTGYARQYLGSFETLDIPPAGS